MEISEIRVQLPPWAGEARSRVLAFCSICFDDAFVVRDVRIIDAEGGPLVAMPSRKRAEPCEACGAKNPLTAAFCIGCGGPFGPRPAPAGPKTGRGRLWAIMMCSRTSTAYMRGGS